MNLRTTEPFSSLLPSSLPGIVFSSIPSLLSSTCHTVWPRGQYENNRFATNASTGVVCHLIVSCPSVLPALMQMPVTRLILFRNMKASIVFLTVHYSDSDVRQHQHFHHPFLDCSLSFNLQYAMYSSFNNSYILFQSPCLLVFDMVCHKPKGSLRLWFFI